MNKEKYFAKHNFSTDSIKSCMDGVVIAHCFFLSFCSTLLGKRVVKKKKNQPTTEKMLAIKSTDVVGKQKQAKLINSVSNKNSQENI